MSSMFACDCQHRISVCCWDDTGVGRWRWHCDFRPVMMGNMHCPPTPAPIANPIWPMLFIISLIGSDTRNTCISMRSHSDDDSEYLCVCLAFSGLWMGLPLNGRMLICVHTRHLPTSSANVVRMHFRQLAAQSNIALEMCRTDAHRNAMQRTRKTIRKTYPQFGRPTPTNYHCWTIYKIGVYMA